MSLLLTLGDTTPNIRTLFANNEQGLALDVEAAYLRGWIFQDSAGATVAASAGDPVGLILDTSKGGLDQLGSDLVSNGTFASDTVWTKGANWTIGSGVATKTGGAANNLTQTISSTAGQWYRITMDVTRTAGTLTVSLGTSGTTRAISADGSYTFFILAGSSTQTLALAGDSSFAGTVDNVTARLVPGNHAYQTTSGSRPLLARTPDGGRRNLLTRSEDLTVGASWGDGGTTATVSTNTIANPLNGEITADTINLQDVSNNRIQQVGLTILNSQTYTLSGYFKNNTMTTGQTFDLRLNNFAGSPNDAVPVARVALADGTVTNQSGGSGVSATSVSITSLSNGWYRVSVTFTLGSGAGTTNAAVQIIRTSSAASFYAFGFQLEVGSLSAYQKVGLTSDVTESGKRDCWGLLFDGSDDSLQTSEISFNTWTQATRRNLLTNPSSFGVWGLQNGATVTENSDVGPSGLQNADTVIGLNGSGASAANQANLSISLNTQHTLSFWVKTGTATSLVFGVLQNGAWLVGTPSVISGPSVSFNSPNTVTVTGLSSSWTRIQFVFTTGGTGLPGVYFYPETSGTSTGKSVVLADAQLELGSSATDFQSVGTDKMNVMAGVQKQQASATGMIAELSVTSSSNNGAWWFLDGDKSGGGAQKLSWRSRGTIPVTVEGAVSTGQRVVFTGIGDISGDISSQRINGVVTETSTSDQGSGNFGNYPIYIGRRAGSTLPFTGILYSLIIRGATTPTGTIADFERNLLRLRAGLGPF
jgi:hypothetical protein